MLVKLAWRSIWRNKRRTIITTGSIAFGLTLAIFFIALGEGMYSDMIDKVVRMQAGHLTIQHPDYAAAPAVDLYVTGSEGMAEEISAWPEVDVVKVLVQGQGIAKSGAGNTAAGIMGVQPSKEGVSPFARSLTAGQYLEDRDERKVVIGAEMAAKLDLAVGKKLVISTNNVDGGLVQELVRVKGVYQTGSEEMDAYYVQMTTGFARRLFGLPPGAAVKVGVVLHDAGNMGKVRRRIEDRVLGPGAAVLPWPEVMPDIASWIRLDQGSNYIFQFILIILILFTIFNTILMSVLERQREFAMLLAIGSEPRLLRAQVFLESLFLALVGCAAGAAGGTLVSWAVSLYGIDMRRWLEEGFAVSGYMMDPVLKTKVTAGVVFGAAGVVLAATLLFSLLPAKRAADVNITDTLRAAG